MKLLASTTLIAFLGLLVYNNAKLESYDQFTNQRILGKTREAKDPLEGMTCDFRFTSQIR